MCAASTKCQCGGLRFGTPRREHTLLTAFRATASVQRGHGAWPCASPVSGAACQWPRLHLVGWSDPSSTPASAATKVGAPIFNFEIKLSASVRPVLSVRSRTCARRMARATQLASLRCRILPAGLICAGDPMEGGRATRKPTLERSRAAPLCELVTLLPIESVGGGRNYGLNRSNVCFPQGALDCLPFLFHISGLVKKRVHVVLACSSPVKSLQALHVFLSTCRR